MEHCSKVSSLLIIRHVPLFPLGYKVPIHTSSLYCKSKIKRISQQTIERPVPLISLIHYHHQHLLFREFPFANIDTRGEGQSPLGVQADCREMSRGISRGLSRGISRGVLLARVLHIDACGVFLVHIIFCYLIVLKNRTQINIS